MIRRSFIAAAVLFLLQGPACAGSTAEVDFFDFEKASLEDILNLKTVAASRLDYTVRETPGIITVVSRVEIINSGARSLVDVLRLVPGLDFGVDVESALGLGVRRHRFLRRVIDSGSCDAILPSYDYHPLRTSAGPLIEWAAARGVGVANASPSISSAMTRRSS